jgi:hypothetical protein
MRAAPPFILINPGRCLLLYCPALLTLQRRVTAMPSDCVIPLE